MTPSDVVRRAKSAIGKPTRYRLGAGGFNPKASHPAQRINGEWCADCSAFCAWALGISRQQPSSVFSPVWIETSRTYADATGRQELFEKVTRAEPGDVLVYGDSGGREGHIGIVTEVTREGKPKKVCHCNGRTPDAIAEEAVRAFWGQRGAIVARFKPLVREPIKPPPPPPLKRVVLVIDGVKTTGFLNYGVSIPFFYPVSFRRVNTTFSGLPNATVRAFVAADFHTSRSSPKVASADFAFTFYELNRSHLNTPQLKMHPKARSVVETQNG